MAVARDESSSHLAKAAASFPTSGMTRGSRVGPHMVFLTCLKALSYVLISGGRRMEFCESIVARSVVVAVSRKDSLLTST